MGGFLWVFKWQLGCKFGIAEKNFPLVSCLYSCFYIAPKFCLSFFHSNDFYSEITFFHIKYFVLSHSINIVLTLSYKPQCNFVIECDGLLPVYSATALKDTAVYISFTHQKNTLCWNINKNFHPQKPVSKFHWLQTKLSRPLCIQATFFFRISVITFSIWLSNNWNT